jgi:hypothetical protein
VSSLDFLHQLIGHEVYLPSCSVSTRFISLGLSNLGGELKAFSKGNFDCLGHVISIVSLLQSGWSGVRILVGRKFIFFLQDAL